MDHRTNLISLLQKSILGLVSSAPCRIDIEFKDAQGRAYKNKVSVKTKGTETEELPLFSNKEDLIGEVGLHFHANKCIHAEDNDIWAIAHFVDQGNSPDCEED